MDIQLEDNVTQTKSNIHFDLLGFLHVFSEGVEADVDHAYPYSDFDEDRAHTALQKISGRLATLKAMLDQIEKV